MDRRGLVEIDIEMPWPMRSGVVFNEDKTGYMINCIVVDHVENDIELLWLIGSGVDYDKN